MERIVFVYVFIFEHNFGTPRAISTKLGTHIPLCMYKNITYIISYASISAGRLVWESSKGSTAKGHQSLTG
jgi:hypothetical protein